MLIVLLFYLRLRGLLLTFSLLGLRGCCFLVVWCFGLYWFGCDFSVVWYCIVMFACVIADLGLIVICVVVLFGFGILLVLLVYLGGGVWCFLLGCRV